MIDETVTSDTLSLPFAFRLLPFPKFLFVLCVCPCKWLKPLWHGSFKTVSLVKPKSVKLEKLIFFWLLVYFNPGLQNDFTLQCLDLCKIDEAKSGISRAKEAINKLPRHSKMHESLLPHY